jgi:hypothetical protein
MTRLLSLLSLSAIALCPLLLAGGAEPSSCQPLGYDKNTLLELRAQEFAIEGQAERQRFAVELLDCLGEPDPELRDKVGYEAYATLLRGGQLDPDTVRLLRAALMERLDNATADEEGLMRPFAALVLSEVARVDRVEPLFSDEERTGLVEAATAYMRSVDDYRGFDDTEGWRHGVAHGADLLMQLALNPALDRDQLVKIRDAVSTQIAPAGAHFYVYGESERLARPILFIALRGEFTDEEWAEWFAGIGSPAPFDAWADVFASQAGLAKLHNTKGFIQVIYVNASASDKAEFAPLASAALSVLRDLP